MDIVKDIDIDIDDSEIIEYIKENYGPDDVFSEEQLIKWAEENGFEEVE